MRIATVADQPDGFRQPYRKDTAAYSLFDHPDATPDHIQAGHRKLVGDGLRRPGVYLLIEDTTVISYPVRRPIPGLGTVGYTSRGETGFHLHTALATRWPGPARPGPRSEERRVGHGGSTR